MILLHVLVATDQVAHQISDYLLETGFIKQTTTTKKAIFKTKTDLNNTVSKEQWLITTKAKAAHYYAIKQKIFDLFEEFIVDMYACPIIDMDWSESQRRSGNLVA